MKMMIGWSAIALLASLSSSASARNEGVSSVLEPVGARVYDLEHEQIGTIVALDGETGQAAAVVERQIGGGPEQVLISLNSLTPREDGGYLAYLTGVSIDTLPPYVPGHMESGIAG